jgi:hypothetical protein
VHARAPIDSHTLCSARLEQYPWFLGMHAHFLSALYAPPASREVSPLCFLSAFASLGDVGVWPAAGSVFWGRSLCMPGEVFVRWRICYAFGA